MKPGQRGNGGYELADVLLLGCVSGGILQPLAVTARSDHYNNLDDA